MHIASHTSIPGYITEGNADADMLVSTALVNTFAQAKASHEFFHQSARSLWKHFHIKLQEAKDIISMCPHCARVPTIQAQGTNL